MLNHLSDYEKIIDGEITGASSELMLLIIGRKLDSPGLIDFRIYSSG